MIRISFDYTSSPSHVLISPFLKILLKIKKIYEIEGNVKHLKNVCKSSGNYASVENELCYHDSNLFEMFRGTPESQTSSDGAMFLGFL